MRDTSGRSRSGSRAGGTRVARRHARFIVHLPVQCARLSTRASGVWRGHTANISGGGIAVELPTRLPPGTRVIIEIRTGIGPLRVEADVLWTRRSTERTDTIRHGLCLADRSELLDLPLNVLLGQWLQRRARREAAPAAKQSAARSPKARSV